MADKKQVDFIAKKKVVEPVKIEFKTKDGKKVSFKARIKVTKPIRIRFKSKK